VGEHTAPNERLRSSCRGQSWRGPRVPSVFPGGRRLVGLPDLITAQQGHGGRPQVPSSFLSHLKSVDEYCSEGLPSNYYLSNSAVKDLNP